MPDSTCGYAQGRIALGVCVLAALSGCGGEGNTQTQAAASASDASFVSDATADVVADSGADGTTGDVTGDASQSLDAEDAMDVADAAETGPQWPLDDVVVTWQPCSLEEGANDGLAECATTNMPLFWDAPDGRTIPIAAKRLKAKGTARTQLWLLHGGPGASGVIGFPSRMQRWHDMDPGLEIYTLDHRGTGYSRRLGCPAAEDPASPGAENITSAEMPDCLTYLDTEFGDGLAAITTTQSAVDLAAYVHATRESGKNVVVWGGSYGTYWAHRYLQVAPSQADGVVIEGIAPADSTFIQFDERTNQTGQTFMQLCAADAYCASKLGPDPWQRLGTLLDNMQHHSHCSASGLSRWDVSLLLAYALYYYPSNSVVPALVYRLERCNAQDRVAINSAVTFWFGSGGVWDISSYSILLQHHITFSEMWMNAEFQGVDLAQYFQQIRDTAYVAKNLGATKLSLSASWPAYQDPTYDEKWATTTTPMLMMQGKVDPATSWIDAVALKDHFNLPTQHFVEFPQAPHGVSSATPVAGTGAEHCGMQLLLAFAQDPQAPLDTSCVDQVLPIDFAGTPELSQAILGTDDFWGDVPAEAGAAPNPSALRAQLQQQMRLDLPWQMMIPKK